MADVDPASVPQPDGPPPPRRRPVLPLLFFFLVLGLVGYFVYGAVDGLVNSNTLQIRIAVVREEIAEFRWQADQLSALAAYLDSDEYIERVAREDLGLVRPGEEAFAILAPPRPGLPITRTPWWANLLPPP